MKNSSLLPFLAMTAALDVSNLHAEEEQTHAYVGRTRSVRISSRNAKSIKANKKNKLARKARKLNRK